MHVASWIAWLLVLASGAWAQKPEAFVGADLEGLGRLTVQHEGRWMPLGSLARDGLWRLTGESSRAGETPVETLLGMTLDPQSWRAVALVPIPSAALRERLGLAPDRARLSYQVLTESEALGQLVSERADLDEQARKRPLWRAVGKLEGKRQLLGSMLSGSWIRPVPVAGHGLAAWRSVAWLAGPGGQAQAPDAAAAWHGLVEAWHAGEPLRLQVAARELIRALDALPRELGPPAGRISMEVDFDGQAALARAWRLLLGGAGCAALLLFGRRRWLQLLAGALLLGGWAQLADLLWIRGQLAGRLPATNMYESLLWLGLGAGAMATIALVVTGRGLVPALSAALAGAALLAAEGLGLDPFIRPAPAVLLDTAWMSLHVPVTMFAYAALGLAVMLAHGQLVVQAVWPSRDWGQVLEQRLLVAVHAGAALLFVGIASGSMWAASSWGRAWGWDPKEVWSLVALLAYMVIVHVRLDRQPAPRWARRLAAFVAAAVLLVILASLPDARPLVVGLILLAAAAVAYLVLGHGRVALALKVLVAFWMVVITYVVVNLVLATGLHSYGFGTGSVSRGLAWSVGAELLFLLTLRAVALRLGGSDR